MSRLLSREEFYELGIKERRAVFGITTNYVTFLRDRFEKEFFITGNTYDLYKKWYELEHSPLGEALR